MAKTKTKKITSKDRLRKFLSDEYIKKGGAEDTSTAIRDCLTDMFHIWDTIVTEVTLHERMHDAREVYIAEKNEIDIK